MSNFAVVYGLARSGRFKGLFECNLIENAVYGMADAAQRIQDKRVKNAEKDSLPMKE